MTRSDIAVESECFYLRVLALTTVLILVEVLFCGVTGMSYCYESFVSLCLKQNQETVPAHSQRSRTIISNRVYMSKLRWSMVRCSMGENVTTALYRLNRESIVPQEHVIKAFFACCQCM